jgi:hypothetical protein
MHDFAGELIASVGSSSASIVTPPNFHFVSLNQGVVLPEQEVNLRCRFTISPPVVGFDGERKKHWVASSKPNSKFGTS